MGKVAVPTPICKVSEQSHLPGLLNEEERLSVNVQLIKTIEEVALIVKAVAIL